jgi:hypothetical protein
MTGGGAWRSETRMIGEGEGAAGADGIQRALKDHLVTIR